MIRCDECNKYLSCNEPCKRVEKYIEKGCRWPDTYEIDKRYLGTKANDFGSGFTIFKPSQQKLRIFDWVEFEFLTTLQNKIINYFYCQGLTYNQIAIRVRKSKTVVKGQIQRARAKIRSYLPYLIEG